jgi:hypothetical protein
MRDTDDHPRDNPHKLQKVLNNQLERGAVNITVKEGESIELSNGTTIVYRKRKGSSVSIIVIAPRNTRIYRQHYKKKDTE